jgi:hypothetical protein
MKEDIKKRFWKYVIKTESCWNWTGATDSFGYGHIGTYIPKRTMIKAHRLSYEMHNGKIPKGLLVCHTCDNPKCVNPKHLWLGTIQDNMDDRTRKMRSSHKINKEIAERIRSMYIPYRVSFRELGQRFGICGGTVSDIIHNKLWVK